MRADGTADFYGIAIRGAPNCGLNFWMVGSTWGPSFGRALVRRRRPADARHARADRAAIEHYVDLVRRAGPPESPTMDFMDCMACYAAGPRRDDDRAGERGVDPLRGGRRGRGGNADGADARRPARHAATSASTGRRTRSRRWRGRRRRLGAREVPLRARAGARRRGAERVRRGGAGLGARRPEVHRRGSGPSCCRRSSTRVPSPVGSGR